MRPRLITAENEEYGAVKTWEEQASMRPRLITAENGPWIGNCRSRDVVLQ